MRDEIADFSAAELTRLYTKRQLSPKDVIAALINRIGELDDTLHAFRTLRLDEVVRESQVLTEELGRGHLRGPLHGIPIAVKELFDVKDVPTSYGSLLFKGYRPSVDAEAVRSLRAAGALIVGSTRSHEFGWGITSQHPVLGGVKNPWNIERVPGGSSGGSAVAVAAGFVPLALGSDTGGSVRIPAAYCGVVGFKPTFGRISKRGLMPLAPSLDHVGVIARTVGDCLLAAGVMSGFDADDPYSARDLPELVSSDSIDRSMASVDVLYPADDDLAVLSEDYRHALERVFACLSDSGVRLKATQITGGIDARAYFGKIQMAESYHQHNVNLSTFPQRQDEYGADVRERLAAAAQVTIKDYLSALDMRHELSRRFDLTLGSGNVLITPVVGGSPTRIVEPDLCEHQGKPTEFRDIVLPFTVPQNLAGVPAITFNVGRDRYGVPIGMQLSAARGQEIRLVQTAARLSELLVGAGIANGSSFCPRPSQMDLPPIQAEMTKHRTLQKSDKSYL